MGQGTWPPAIWDERMNWTSWDEFWHMGGYGLYVWGSYGAALLVMVLEPLFAQARLKAARRAAVNESGAT